MYTAIFPPGMHQALTVLGSSMMCTSQSNWVATSCWATWTSRSTTSWTMGAWGWLSANFTLAISSEYALAPAALSSSSDMTLKACRPVTGVVAQAASAANASAGAAAHRAALLVLDRPVRVAAG